MKFSVVIPAYNEENLLPATLQALEAATGDLTFERIVVDNESTDRTAQIAHDFGVKIVSESEHNIAKVRNTGAQHASGEFIIFLDADTRAAPSLLQKIHDAMKDEKCFGGAVSVEYDESKRKWMKYYLRGWKFWEKFFNMKQGAAQFYRKAIFEKLGGYDTTIFVGEDIDFYWRMAKFARRNEGHLSFIENPKVKTSARRLDKTSFWKTFVHWNPMFIRLAWRRKSVWKDWYEKTFR
jgi:cellulose synthase/poly-beta-1,6-N-acetylglucosamine synthase-like glycosyltransferase